MSKAGSLICQKCKQRKCEKSKNGYRKICWVCRMLKNEGAERYALRRKQQNLVVKRQVVAHYGGVCICCGESILEFLTIDHKNGGGNAHRKHVGREGTNFYRWIIRSSFPVDLQILCFNCNCGRQLNGGICPHQRFSACVVKPE